MNDEIKTFRGRTLDEVLQRIREDLGPDAVVVGRREATTGGVGGFFAKREIELAARRPGLRLDIREDSDAGPFAGPIDRPELAEPFAAALARLGVEHPPAPATPPTVHPGVDEQPQAGDSFPDAWFDPSAAPEAEAEAAEPEPEPVPQAPEAEAPDVEAEPQAWPAEQRPWEEPAAAIEQPEPLVPNAPEPSYELDVVDAAPTVPAVVAEAHAVSALVDRGLGPALAHAIVNEAVNHLMPLSGSTDLAPVLRDAIGRRIPIADVRRGPGGGGVVGFVGPGGSGKTRCVAALATAYAARSPLPVACVTLRPKDGGAELRRLLAPVGVPIHAEADAEAAAARVESLRDSTLVLLDTPSLPTRDESALGLLADELEALRPDELHACLPATLTPGPGRRITASARRVGATSIAITHADETDELGGVLELAIESELPLSLLGDSPEPDAGLHQASSDMLALALVP